MDRAELIRAAFIEPIRSVMLVDDQFPTYGELIRGQVDHRKEAPRAGALYEWYSSKGMRCVIESAPIEPGNEVMRRITDTDFLVLDYHWHIEDPTPCLKVLQALDSSEHANLVVVLTRDPLLEKVRLQCALALSGRPPELSVDHKKLIEEDDDDDVKVEPWDPQHLTVLREALGAEPASRKLPHPRNPRAKEASKSWSILRSGASLKGDNSWADPASPQVRLGEADVDGGTYLYLASRNVFVVFVHKSDDYTGEGQQIDSAVEACLAASKPSDFSCYMALARAQVIKMSRERLRSERPHDLNLEAGWWRYIFGADDARGRSERISKALAVLLDQLTDEAAVALAGRVSDTLQPSEADVWEAVKARVPKWDGERSAKTGALFAVNRALSTRTQRPFITAGTVVAVEGGKDTQFLLCASPACDMVPREPKKAWTKGLHPWRPAMFIRLSVEADVENALRDAEQGRHIFLRYEDRDVALSALQDGSATVSQEILLVSTETVLPSHEESSPGPNGPRRFPAFALSKATGQSVPSLMQRNLLVVGQLAAPYAERMVQLLGNHLSRVGPDFLNHDRPVPAEPAMPKPDPV